MTSITALVHHVFQASCDDLQIEPSQEGMVRFLTYILRAIQPRKFAEHSKQSSSEEKPLARQGSSADATSIHPHHTALPAHAPLSSRSTASSSSPSARKTPSHIDQQKFDFLEKTNVGPNEPILIDLVLPEKGIGPKCIAAITNLITMLSDPCNDIDTSEYLSESAIAPSISLPPAHMHMHAGSSCSSSAAATYRSSSQSSQQRASLSATDTLVAPSRVGEESFSSDDNSEEGTRAQTERNSKATGDDEESQLMTDTEDEDTETQKGLLAAIDEESDDGEEEEMMMSGGEYTTLRSRRRRTHRRSASATAPIDITPTYSQYDTNRIESSPSPSPSHHSLAVVLSAASSVSHATPNTASDPPPPPPTTTAATTCTLARRSTNVNTYSSSGNQKRASTNSSLSSCSSSSSSSSITFASALLPSSSTTDPSSASVSACPLPLPQFLPPHLLSLRALLRIPAAALGNQVYGMRVLQLPHNSFGDEGVESLCCMIERSPHLSLIDLRSNGITSFGMRRLVDAILRGTLLFCFVFRLFFFPFFFHTFFFFFFFFPFIIYCVGLSFFSCLLFFVRSLFGDRGYITLLPFRRSIMPFGGGVVITLSVYISYVLGELHRFVSSVHCFPPPPSFPPLKQLLLFYFFFSLFLSFCFSLHCMQCNAGCVSSLKILDVSSMSISGFARNSVGERGFIALADLLRHPSCALQELYLSNIPSGGSGVAHMCKHGLRYNRSLSVLDVRNNGLGDEDVVELCAALLEEFPNTGSSGSGSSSRVAAEERGECMRSLHVLDKKKEKKKIKKEKKKKEEEEEKKKKKEEEEEEKKKKRGEEEESSRVTTVSEETKAKMGEDGIEEKANETHNSDNSNNTTTTTTTTTAAAVGCCPRAPRHSSLQRLHLSRNVLTEKSASAVAQLMVFAVNLELLDLR